MSAWLCSDKHLSLLAIKYVQLCTNPEYTTKIKNERALQTYKTLKRANVYSLHVRYGEGKKNNFAFTDDIPYDMSLIGVYKQAQCYDYQACEYKTYERSLACGIIKKLLTALEVMEGGASLGGMTSGYEEEPWGID